MFIQGVGTSVPKYRYSQREGWEALCRSEYLPKLSSRSQAILRKVLCGDSGIQFRHFSMERLEEAFSIDPNILHRRFADHAPELAANAARAAMSGLSLPSEKIDALLVSTCTGYICPGLTSYVSELLGLRSDALLLDLVGQGCGAAVPNLQTANALISSGQAEHVLSVCVEICSAAFYLDNDPGVLISACLFGDGAAAAITGKEPGRGGRSIRWHDFATVLNPKERELLRFENRDGMLRNVLDKSVPILVVEQMKRVLAALLERSKLSQGEIQEWILHSGGRDVLAAVQNGMGVPPDKLRWSAGVLRDYGNLSSPSVLFALDRALQANAPGGKWLLASFGAGIACHGALLEVA